MLLFCCVGWYAIVCILIYCKLSTLLPLLLFLGYDDCMFYNGVVFANGNDGKLIPKLFLFYVYLYLDVCAKLGVILLSI